MDAPDPERHTEQHGAAFLLRAITLVLLVPALIVIAWAAFNLQGYQNDPQSAVFQTWPVGVASLALAASLAWLAIRPSRESPQKVVTAGAFVAFMVSWILVLN
jgi:FtsH-binding integral membrane protein